MVINQLRYLLTDNESLEQYFRGIPTQLNDVKRRMFLKAREQNRSIPDHYYRLAQEETFKNVASLPNLLCTKLRSLAEEYLEIDGNRIFVNSLMQNDWQELITFIPPMLLQCALIAGMHQPDFINGDRALLMSQYILPNIRHTAMPSPRIRQLDFLMDRHAGLHDLHIHLNGTLEVDQVWQDYLANPLAIRIDLEQASRDPRTKEQLEQESTLLTPGKFYRLLIAARRIRYYFWNYFFSSKSESSVQVNTEQLITVILSEEEVDLGPSDHPFAAMINSGDGLGQNMAVEAMMYVLIFNDLREKSNERIANLFHFYLLILGLTNRLLVQQTHQKGFQQFQKHTVNGLRWQSELTYFRRYFQLSGNEQRFITFLEGRFAPKETESDTIQLVDAIYAGWELLLDHRRKMGLDTMPELKLIAHFIKQTDNYEDATMRHASLRRSIWRKGVNLASLVKAHPNYGDLIVGIDAASSEFDAPPEVFAPVFRLMRRSGFRHFTFHAGEDFYHIVSGLRAIYEAIKFCDLRNGDRIGHATAAGLRAELWKSQVGDTLLMRKADVLDDLIFVYHMIVSRQVESLESILPSLVHQVTAMGHEIYEMMVPISVWEKAWLMRQSCPMHILNPQEADIPIQYFDIDEWSSARHMIAFSGEAMWGAHNSDGPPKQTELELLARYHTEEYRKKGEEIVVVNPFEILTTEVITQLQLGLLKYMNSREIVIETLPTSNVRIGIHHDFKSYQLHNWMQWRELGYSIPPIVVGSDDTGIFATNIYNEYANIYCSMLAMGKSLDTVVDVIKKLVENARVYRFYGAEERTYLARSIN